MPSLGLIKDSKNIQNTFQPLLVASIVFKDSKTAPTILLLSSHYLTAANGTQPTGISGFPYNANDFDGLLKNQEIAATQALSDQGIDVTPTVTLEIADANKNVWNTYEKAIGFKGARLTLYYLFWEVGTANFSSDYRPIFSGICGPGRIRDTTVTVQAISKMNMNQVYLPITRIQKRCPWVFPDTRGMILEDATAIQQAAADDPSLDTWHCGYSYLASGGEARGNPIPGTTDYFTDCNFTFDDCLDRLGDRSRVYSSGGIAPIERDLSNRVTARFGGVHWDQPSQFKSRGFGQSKSEVGFNATNEGKYNEYVPMGWGTYWIDPVVLNIVGDANFTRMEVLVGMGNISDVRHVICNDIDVDKLASDSGTRNAQVAIQLWWAELTSGDRSGKVNGTSIYDGNGDPYGSYKVLVVNVPRQLTPSSSVPRLRVLLDGPKIRNYANITSIDVTGGVAVATIEGPNRNIASNNSFPFDIEGNSKSDVNGGYTSLTNWTFGPPGTFEFPTGAADGTGTGGTIQYDTFSSNPAWVILDALIWMGWTYAEIDLQTFIKAAAFYEDNIPYNNISGYVDVLNDGATVTQVSGNDYSTLTPGATVFINGISKVVNTVDSYTQFTITVPFAHLGPGHPNTMSSVTFLGSGPNVHARFKLGFGLSQRISGSDILRQLRTTCRSTIIPAGDTGLLQLFPDKSLADQQFAAVTGSNYDTQIKSIQADGTPATGYVAWQFDYSNIMPKGNNESSLTLDQLDSKDAPNRVSFPFYDEDNGWAQDSLTLLDSVDIQRVERPIDGGIPLLGLVNFDQAKRVASVWMARNLRGNTRQDTGGTWTFNLDTSFKCVHLRVGHLVLVNYTQLAIDQGLVDDADVPVAGFLARVMAIKPTANFQSAQITIQFHDDNWYVDAFEQNGFQKQSPQFRNALTRPSFPWLPYQQQPLSGDPLYALEDWQMGIQQAYDVSSDLRPLARVIASGKAPINDFAKDGLTPPSVNAQGTTAPTGGTVVAGRRYYAQVCVQDTTGKITPPSDPTQPCIIDVPAGANTATLTVPIFKWPKNAVKYQLFAGLLRNKLSNQAEGTVSPPGDPTDITITDFKPATWGVPDVEFNSMSIRGKRVFHPGVLECAVDSCDATTITLSFDTSGDPLVASQFAPDSGHPYYMILLGLLNNANPIPVANWEITDNDGTGNGVFHVTGPDPTTIDRGDGTVGLQAGDIIAITMRPTVGASAPFTDVLGTAVGTNDSVVTIDGVDYTFKTVINNANSNEVLIGGSITASVSNLKNAIIAGAGSGTAYSSATTAHPTVTASSATVTLTVTYLTVGQGYGVIVTSGTGSPFGVATQTLQGGGKYIEDANLVNSINAFFGSLNINDATNAEPIVITTNGDHSFHTGNKVYIIGVEGNAAANGVFWIDVLGPDTFAIYSDSGLTVPRAGDGNYTGNGIVRGQQQGLLDNGEVGRELYFAFGTGTGSWYKIKSNTATRIYIDGDWVVTPDATTIPFIMNSNWEFENNSDSLSNSRSDVAISFTLDIPNFFGQLVFVQGFTADGGGNEAFRGFSPWRLIHIFGVPGDTIIFDWEARAILPGAQVIATDVLEHRFRVKLDPSKKATLFRCSSTAKVNPSGGNFVADILRSNDGGSSWASIFPSGALNKAVILSTQQQGEATTFAITELFNDDMLRVDVVTGSSASGIELVLKGIKSDI